MPRRNADMEGTFQVYGERKTAGHQVVRQGLLERCRNAQCMPSIATIDETGPRPAT